MTVDLTFLCLIFARKSCLTTEADVLAFFWHRQHSLFTWHICIYICICMFGFYFVFFFWEGSTAQKLGQRMSPARFNTRSSLIFIHLHVLHCIRCSLFIIRGLQPGSQTVTASNKWQLPQIASSAVVAYL